MQVAQMDWGLCNLHVCILDWADYFRERAEFISVFDENRCEYYFRAVRRDQRPTCFYCRLLHQSVLCLSAPDATGFCKTAL